MKRMHEEPAGMEREIKVAERMHEIRRPKTEDM